MAKQIITKGIADNAVTDEKILLGNDTWLRARNAADTADVNLIGVNLLDETVSYNSFLPRVGTDSVVSNYVDNSSASPVAADVLLTLDTAFTGQEEFGSYQIASAFTPIYDGDVQTIYIYLSDVGVSAGDLFVNIYADNSGEPGVLLGTSDLVSRGTISSPGLYAFTFTTPVPILGGQMHWASLEGDSVYVSSASTVSLGRRDADFGDHPVKWYDGALWQDPVNSYSVRFQVYGEQQVTAFIDLGKLTAPWDNAFLNELRLTDDDNTNYVGFKAPSVVASDQIWILPDADGTAGQALVTDGAGNLSFDTVTTSPGGVNTNVQYNNAGAFGGSNLFTWNNSIGSMRLNMTSGGENVLIISDDSNNTGSRNIKFEDGNFPLMNGYVSAAGVSGGGTFSGATQFEFIFGTTQTHPTYGKTAWFTANQRIFSVSGGASPALSFQKHLHINAQNEVRFQDADSSNYVALRAAATVASDVTWTLPAADGSSGQYLQTDGAGILSWQTIAAGANTALSNLASTAINTDLTWGAGVAGLLRTADSGATTQNLVVRAGDSGGSGTAGTLTLRSGGNSGSNNTGAVLIQTGDHSGVGSGVSGAMTIRTGTTNTNASGALSISTGNSTNNSGNISIAPGSATNRGSVFIDAPTVQIGTGAGIVENVAGVFRPAISGNTFLGDATHIWNTAEMFVQNIRGTAGNKTSVLYGHDLTLPDGSVVQGSLVSDTGHTTDLAIWTWNQAASKSIKIQTGNGGGGNSGDIVMRTGTSSATRGNIKLVDGSEGTVGHVWTQTNADGSGEWQAAGGGGANTALSNLITTSINQNLLPDTLGRQLGSTATNKRWSLLTLEQAAADVIVAYSDSITQSLVMFTNNTGPVSGATGSGLKHPVAGNHLLFYTASRTLQNSRDIYLETGNYNGTTGGQSSGLLSLRTGNATAAAGSSGDILIQTGTIVSGGTRGDIRLVNGTEGTVGHVWTQTAADGSGAWQAASGGGTQRVEYRTITSGEASADQLTLAFTPADPTLVQADIFDGGGPMEYTAEFTVTGTTFDWSGGPYSGVFVAGDRIRIVYWS